MRAEINNITIRLYSNIVIRSVIVNLFIKYVIFQIYLAWKKKMYE